MTTRSIPALMLIAAATWWSAAATSLADGHEAEVCTGFGPQTPRDIDALHGENARVFPLAPPAESLNLCNIHFHAQAEHKARDFSIAAVGKNGEGAGWQCAIGESLTRADLRAPEENFCKGVAPGDTIEVHWVHTSCDVTPGEGLGSCLSDACANPSLRVETQVFTLVNDENALQFDTMGDGAHRVDGYYQARDIPDNTGAPVEFLGSTTGPKYTQSACSPLQVTWSVRPQCAKLDINSLSRWCENNAFGEDQAHGVRELVTDPRLLSPIR